MTDRTMLRPVALTTLLLALAVLPAAGMQEEDVRHGVRLAAAERMVGDDAPDDPSDTSADVRPERRVERRHLVFVDEEGTTHEIDGGDGAFGWIATGSPHQMRFHLPKIAAGLDGKGGFLGVTGAAMTPELRRHFGAPTDAGVMISKVVDDSAAFRAGLLVGDILTAVDGESIADQMDLMQRIRRHEEGDAVTLDIVRDGKAERLTAVLDQTSGPELGQHFAWAYRLDCDDEDGDCDRLEIDLCDDDPSCEVKIDCTDGECSCTAGGEIVECDRLEGIHRFDGD